jgi:hypothetical protein
VPSPGDTLRNLYDLRPAITCPICDKTAKVNVIPRIHNQEGAELTTTNLNLYQFNGPGAIKCYAIDVLTGDIEVTAKVDKITIPLIAKDSLPLMFEIMLNYCDNKVGTATAEYPAWATYPHYYELFELDIDIELAMVTKVSMMKFGLMNRINNQFASIEVDAETTDIRRDARSQNDIKSQVSTKVQPVSVEKAAALIKSTKYMNFL